MTRVVTILAAFAGCTPKAPPAVASEPSRSLSWVEIEPGKDLCVSGFPDAPWPARADVERFAGVLRQLEAGALQQARAALEPLPGEHPAVQGTGAILGLLEGQLDGPVQILSDLADSHPQDTCIASTAALALWAAGEVPQAITLLKQARSQAPLDGRIAFLSWFLSIEGPEALLPALDAGLQLQPDHAGMQLARGAVAMELGDLDAAVPLLVAAEASGLAEADGPLLQAYFLIGDRPSYLRAASRLGLPLGDEGAIAEADDPEQAYDALVGVSPGQDLVAVLHTSMGEVSCVLHRGPAPVTVANFVGLARGTLPWLDPRSGGIGRGSLYEGTTFHRVIPEFMIQGGDPLGDGTGGPGYRFLDELSDELSFDRPGVLAMANSGPHTNGSQFFVTEVPVPRLDGGYTIFGQCDPGDVAVVAQIARVETDADRPVEPVSLERVEIRTVARVGEGGGASPGD